MGVHPAITRLDSIRRLVEDVAADARYESEVRMLASAIESTIENLLDLIKGASISWPSNATEATP